MAIKMFGRSIQLKITLGFLVLGITACKDKHSQNQLNAEIHAIEAHLDLNGSELSTLQRLQKINLALAKQEDFETSIIILNDVDTISFGETLKVHFIPIRTSKIDKMQSAAINIADSFWTIKQTGFDSTTYYLETDFYKAGENRVLGLIPIDNDTILVEHKFYVSKDE